MMHFFRWMLCLATAGLLLTACDKNKNQVPEPVAPGSEVIPTRDIALEIYNLIPKEDLPDYCRALQRDTTEDAAAESRNTLYFSDSVQGYEIDMDPGLYGYFTLQCYPLDSGGWRAYWVSYAGYDGLCGYDRSGAYNYVDGKLTPETNALLPCPDAKQLMDYSQSNVDLAEIQAIAEQPNYQYTFGDKGLGVSLDLDYLTYGEEYMDADEERVIVPTVETWNYVWNGKGFVRVDAEGKPIAK